MNGSRWIEVTFAGPTQWEDGGPTSSACAKYRAWKILRSVELRYARTCRSSFRIPVEVAAITTLAPFAKIPESSP